VGKGNDDALVLAPEALVDETRQAREYVGVTNMYTRLVPQTHIIQLCSSEGIDWSGCMPSMVLRVIITRV
jgi:hypothetical protein